ncbi:ABC transporter ATP-binding protein [Paenibacillus piri]|uniref:ABC transporter ATP-binding protein n=1 Tax=Paenibacillus piri TaxID=2547395 RepID=A0A4R5KB45_9BACL|nr:ABC transporter ATP-binding protein [Paenibacillus piri]TDF91735.1 ABC transporter ATP-binding protein [Paenibacillus piri]
MTAIRTKHIELHVGAFHLNNISISIPRGKITAIVGPNGSGKSTLLKVISTLLHANKGEVVLHNKPITAYRPIELAQTVAMLTQSSQPPPDMTVRELISYGRSPHKRLFDRMTAEDERHVEWALNVTGTKKHENRMIHTLSGGEQQKARIAMILAQQTNIILLDEPTTFLDIAHQLDVMEMLQKINQEYPAVTVVSVLHDLQQAANYCHHMIAMKSGAIHTAGAPKQILNPQLLKDVYNIEAKVTFEDDYPVIIPIKTLEASRRN